MTHSVEMLLVGGHENEPTTVKVNDDRKFFYCVLRGNKYAEPEFASWFHLNVVFSFSCVGYGGIHWKFNSCFSWKRDRCRSFKCCFHGKLS
ncbi:hypothetical protein Hanom_Chr05g00404741 [Helianthus anomalus]